MYNKLSIALGTALAVGVAGVAGGAMAKVEGIPSSLGQQSHFLVNILPTVCTHSAVMILQSIVSTKWVVLRLVAKATSFQLNIMMMNQHLHVLPACRAFDPAGWR